MASVTRIIQSFVPVRVAPRDSESELAVAVAFVTPEDGTIRELRCTSMAPYQVPYGTAALAWTLFTGPGPTRTVVSTGSFSGNLDFAESVVIATGMSDSVVAGDQFYLVVYDNAGGAESLPIALWELDIEVAA